MATERKKRIDWLRNNDKFYTSATTIELIEPVLRKLLDDLSLSPTTMDAIEPSAGSGAFLPLLQRLGFGSIHAFDLHPEHPDVVRQDFLALSETRISMARDHEAPAGHDAPSSEDQSLAVVIGNPPFGRKASLAVAFINHALTLAPVVVFIVPVQLRKWITQKTVRVDARLVLDETLPEMAFELDGKPYGVRCCLQAWARPDLFPAQRLAARMATAGLHDLRLRDRPAIAHPDFRMWQYNATPQALKFLEEPWDFAVLRQGFGDYATLHPRSSALCRRKQWILFAAEEPRVLARLRSMDFETLSRTNTAVRGFGKTEIVSAYIRVLETESDEALIRPTPDATSAAA